MSQYVKIARNANTSLEHYHTEKCSAIHAAKNVEQIKQSKADRLGLKHCPHCQGTEQPTTHDTRYIQALRAAGGD